MPRYLRPPEKPNPMLREGADPYRMDKNADPIPTDTEPRGTWPRPAVICLFLVVIGMGVYGYRSFKQVHENSSTLTQKLKDSSEGLAAQMVLLDGRISGTQAAIKDVEGMVRDIEKTVMRNSAALHRQGEMINVLHAQYVGIREWQMEQDNKISQSPASRRWSNIKGNIAITRERAERLLQPPTTDLHGKAGY